MIYITAAKQMCLSHEITQVSLVSTLHNPADVLSNVKYNGAVGKLIQTGLDNFSIEQWIIRWDQEVIKWEKRGTDYDDAWFCNW